MNKIVKSIIDRGCQSKLSNEMQDILSMEKENTVLKGALRIMACNSNMDCFNCKVDPCRANLQIGTDECIDEMISDAITRASEAL